MISVVEALERVLDYVEVLEPERRSILDCLGQVLAEDVCSTVDIPPLERLLPGPCPQKKSVWGRLFGL